MFDGRTVLHTIRRICREMLVEEHVCQLIMLLHSVFKVYNQNNNKRKLLMFLCCDMESRRN